MLNRKKIRQVRSADQIDEFTDERGRACIAVQLIRKKYGISRGTYMLWTKHGCELLDFEKPEVWIDKVEGLTARGRAFTVKDFLDRHREARKRPHIPEGWCTLAQAIRRIAEQAAKGPRRACTSPFTLLALARRKKITARFISWPVNGGRTVRKLIFPNSELDKFHAAAEYKYPGLVTATQTGLTKAALHYLSSVGKLWSEKKPAIEPKSGCVVRQIHYKVAEIEKLKARLGQRAQLGDRVHTDPDGTRWYPQREAAERAGIPPFSLPSLRNRSTRGSRGVVIRAKQVKMAAYRSKHGPKTWVYLEWDLDLLHARLNNLPEPKNCAPSLGAQDAILKELKANNQEVIKKLDAVAGMKSADGSTFRRESEFQRAEWFKDKYGITPDSINKARCAGKLPSSQKRGGRWYHSIAEAAAIWTDAIEADESRRNGTKLEIH